MPPKAELPTIAQNLLNRETFNVIGSVFSIASFILSIFVLWNIRTIRNAYKLRGRGPSLIRDLSKAASNLSKFMNEFDDFIPQVSEELGRVAVKLRSLESKLGGQSKRSVKRLRRRVDRCEVSVQNEEQVRLTYVDIVKVIEELKDRQKDLDWEL